MQHDSLTVIVFAKPPWPGQSKTRLAKSVGEVSAAALAYAFLRDSLQQLDRFYNITPVLATTEDWPHTEFPLPIELEIWQQGPGDLGMRIERMMWRALQRTATCISIGADTPGLPEKLMLESVHWLQEHDAVFGPAHDGGFYLIGLRKCVPGMFADLPWSRDNTLAATEARFREYGFSTRRASPWFDIDTIADLERLQRMLKRGVVQAPMTLAELDTLSLSED